MDFIDREKEMQMLEDAMQKKKSMVVLYGRRRVGKTALVKKFIENRDSVYLYIPLQSEGAMLRYLAETLYRYTGNPLLRSPFSSFRQFMEYLASLDRISVLDEFQRLERIEGAISILQDIWDSSESMNLILTGSSMGMIHSLALSGNAPLFGRRTLDMKLRPFRPDIVFSLAGEVAKGMDFYSVFGGTPAYLQDVQWDHDIISNVERLILRKGAPLYSEPEYLIRSETRDASTYLSVLKYISMGKQRLGDISDMLGMERNKVSFYLSVLENDMDLVRKEVPVTEDQRKSRKGRYVIDDPFFRFWFRYVFPYESELEMEKVAEVSEIIRKDLPSHVGMIAEEVVRGYLADEWPEVGSWWNRSGDEIDIVALNEKKKEILFGEVKWRNRPVGCDVLDELMEKKDLVQWHNKDRKERFMLVSKSGFTKKCLERMDDEGVMHWDMDDMRKILSSDGKS